MSNSKLTRTPGLSTKTELQTHMNPSKKLELRTCLSNNSTSVESNLNITNFELLRTWHVELQTHSNPRFVHQNQTSNPLKPLQKDRTLNPSEPRFINQNCWKSHSWNLDTCDFYINSTHVVKINFMRYLPKLHWFLGFYLFKMHEVTVYKAYSIFLYASLLSVKVSRKHMYARLNITHSTYSLLVKKKYYEFFLLAAMKTVA